MNVLIVDDQRDVVDGLADGIHWGELGIGEVFPAYGAAEARAVLENRPVHLMLCDIEMPEQNGLDLYRWVRSRYPDVECIFLTAHAEFGYAKEALELGSINYILQPASYSDISEAVAQAVRRIREEEARRKAAEYGSYWSEKRDALLDNSVRSYIGGLDNDTKKLWKDLESLGYLLGPQTALLPILLQFTGEKTPKRADIGALLREAGVEGALIVRMDRQNWLLLLCDYIGRDLEGDGSSDGDLPLGTFSLRLEHLRRWGEESLGTGIALYLGESTDFPGLREMYQELYRLKKQNVASYGRVFVLGQEERQESADGGHPPAALWAKLIQSGGTGAVRRDAHAYLERHTRSGTMDTTLLGRFHHDFSHMLLELVKELEPDRRDELFGGDNESYIGSYSSLEEMHRFIDTAVDFLEANLFLGERKPTPVELVERYIDENMEAGFGRAEIAEAIHFNPEYLSRLFKKETGVNLVDFIVRRKMETAQALLRGTDTPVYLVASKVGYGNYSYFSKVFKKYCGLTPQEYRTKKAHAARG